MTITLADLITARSAQQVINDFLQYVANPPDPDLVSLRTANWRTGGPYRTLIYRQGIEASLLYQVVAYLAGASSVRYAVGKWLDWLGEGIFNEPRQEAQFATVTMQFTVPLGAGPLGPLELRVATPSGLEFVSVNLETIPPGPAVVSFPFKAAKAGAAWNVGANTITQLVSPNVLGISVTNLADAIGGYDFEPDDRYAQRLLAKWGRLSTGSTANAYIYWALTASREVKRVRVYSDLLAGTFTPNYVTILLATDTGPVTLQTISDVGAYIAPLVPLDIKIDVDTVSVKTVNVTGTAKIFGQYLSGAAAKISTSLQALAAQVPIGSYDQGPVPLIEVESAVVYDRREVYDFAAATPAGPTSLLYNELLQLTNGVTLVGV
jgi:hypothetical protein